MTAQDYILVAAAFGSLLLSLGAGAKWLLAHIDQRTMASEAREAEARKELKDRLEAEIAELRRAVQQLMNENAGLRTEKNLHVRRIGHLENAIYRQPGMNLPDTEGWPQK